MIYDLPKVMFRSTSIGAEGCRAWRRATSYYFHAIFERGIKYIFYCLVVQL